MIRLKLSPALRLNDLLPTVHIVVFNIFYRDQLYRHQQQGTHLFPLQELVHGSGSLLTYLSGRLGYRSLDLAVADHGLDIRRGIDPLAIYRLQQII